MVTGLAGEYNFTIQQGSDFALQGNLLDDDDAPIDLTNYTLKLQARINYYSSIKILDLTSAGGSPNIFLNNPSTGSFLIVLSDTITAAIDANEYVYDLEATDGSGKITRLMQGIITLSPEVTR